MMVCTCSIADQFCACGVEWNCYPVIFQSAFQYSQALAHIFVRPIATAKSGSSLFEGKVASYYFNYFPQLDAG